jgi:hypothetical protein
MARAITRAITRGSQILSWYPPCCRQSRSVRKHGLMNALHGALGIGKLMGQSFLVALGKLLRAPFALDSCCPISNNKWPTRLLIHPHGRTKRLQIPVQELLSMTKALWTFRPGFCDDKSNMFCHRKDHTLISLVALNPLRYGSRAICELIMSAACPWASPFLSLHLYNVQDSLLGTVRYPNIPKPPDIYDSRTFCHCCTLTYSTVFFPSQTSILKSILLKYVVTQAHYTVLPRGWAESLENGHDLGRTWASI